MKTVLLCHHDDDLNREGLARWLGSFCELAGILVVRETSVQKRARLHRERKRVGLARLLDILAYRIFHRLRWRASDLAAEARILARLRATTPPLAADLPVLEVASPNSPAAREFLARLRPDLAVARIKVILKPEIFEIPARGTYVMHPGVCPEYRNAHGGFWALAEGDPARVGMTLLKVDRGIDTGPVLGYYRYPFDERRESHIEIQHRVVFDNLDAIASRLREIHAGTATPLDTAGRTSRNWGQPWLTRYLSRGRRLPRESALLYHDVIATGRPAAGSGFGGADADRYKLPEALFERHLAALGALPATLTFDDGGVTALEPTASRLERHGRRGVFFVVTARIGTPGFLDADQIRALRRRGHLIGSHSHSHPAGFSRLPYAEMVREWRQSREILEGLLGEPVPLASVPGGYYSTAVARAAAEAGYRALYNSEPTARGARFAGLDVRGRYGIQRSTSPALARALARGDFAPRLAQTLTWNLKKPLKKVGGPAWLAFRRWLLNRVESVGQT